MLGRKCWFAATILVIFSLVFLNFAFAVQTVLADEPNNNPSAIAINIYSGLTNLNPDQSAHDWLATHKTSQDLERLTAYLLGIVYQPQSSEKLAVNLYKAITGFDPDEQAGNWLMSHKSKEDLIGLTKYLLSITLPSDISPDWENVLAGNQIVSYYGHPHAPPLGILGEYSAEDLVPLLEAKAREYDELNGERGVIPAFHIIFGTVHPGGFIGIIDDATLIRYIEIARQNNMVVILDHQIGRGAVTDAVAQMLPYLRYDNVHLAIDPEWHTAFPMQEVGGISGYDVNAAQELMQSYMEENNISGKRILIVHQFAPIMITQREVISADYSKIDLVHDMDGFGHPITKNYHYEYNKLAANIPLKGFKLFYAGRRAWGYDNPLMTPEQVLSLDPPPVVIIYQ